MMSDRIIFEVRRQGHRGEYLDLFSRMLKGDPVCGFSPSNVWKGIHAPSALFSSCDDYLIPFFFMALLRTWSRKSTVALTTRPESVFKNKSLRLRIKRLIYACLKSMKEVKLYSILPFYVEPRLAELVDDWVYDPQFWDLLAYPGSSDADRGELLAWEISFAEKKIKVVLPGQLSRRKGASYMMDLFLSSPSLRERCQFLLCGKVLDLDSRLIDRFRAEGGVVVDRYVTMAELHALYARSDIIWSCYPPYFNHSSGICGRALQAGVPVIMREGSYLDRLDLPSEMKCSLRYDDSIGDSDRLLSFLENRKKSSVVLSSKEKVTDFFN